MTNCAINLFAFIDEKMMNVLNFVDYEITAILTESKTINDIML